MRTGQWAIDDLRVNYSKSSLRNSSAMDDYGGAVPLTDSLVFPTGVSCATGSFNITLMGFAGYSYCNTNGNDQKQVNVVDSFTKVAGNHHLKAGVDYRQTPQTTYRKPYSESVSFNGLNVYAYSFITGLALNAQVSSSMTAVYPVYTNFSMYGQDTWRASDRTTVTYGLRWDVNPARTTSRGPKPFALSNDAIAGVTQNDPLYPTRWLDVAPRFGVAYLSDNRPGHEMVLRLGIGLFYDPGMERSAAPSAERLIAIAKRYRRRIFRSGRFTWLRPVSRQPGPMGKLPRELKTYRRLSSISGTDRGKKTWDLGKF